MYITGFIYSANKNSTHYLAIKCVLRAAGKYGKMTFCIPWNVFWCVINNTGNIDILLQNDFITPKLFQVKELGSTSTPNMLMKVK